ncbi:hypothetical protein [Paenibacillus sp. MBLB4367]|uniref:hypothetical protein n=1 Tax=Paenibacillus sp. MBLB4367 TaxID=3384767 RepID=UPI003908269F
MSVMPKRHAVTIVPSVDPGADPWDTPVSGSSYPLRCRVREGSKVVRNSQGAEVVSTAQVFFTGLVNIRLFDVIEFRDELGNVREFRPISIEIIRKPGGQVVDTLVNC